MKPNISDLIVVNLSGHYLIFPMNSIKVAVRVRPLFANASERCWCSDQTTLSSNMSSTVYNFDNVFNESENNSSLYNSLVSPIVSQAIEGFHGTVFAYGQTAAGKTHSMMGSHDDPGVVYRALSDIFDHIEASFDRHYLVRVSFIEIYNEDIFDLLEPQNKPCLRTDAQTNSVVLCSVQEFVVMSVEGALELLEKGNQRRHVGATRMNDRSSRSHAIFRIILESRDKSPNSDGAVRISHLNFVDLAGSESASKTGAKGIQLRETGNINKSIFALGTLISKLQSSPSGFVNYRDSKLTHVLSNALGGNSLTVMICCINPHVKHFEVTKSTLDFAMRAKSVQNRAKINEVLDDRALLKRYENEIKELKEKNLQLLLSQRLIDEERKPSSFNRRLTWCPSLNTASRKFQKLSPCQSPIEPNFQIPPEKRSSMAPSSPTLEQFEVFKRPSQTPINNDVIIDGYQENSSQAEIIKKQAAELDKLKEELKDERNMVADLKADYELIQLQKEEISSIKSEKQSEIEELKSENGSLLANKEEAYLELEKQLCEKNKEIVDLNQLNEELTQNVVNLESSLISARDELEYKEVLSTRQSVIISDQKDEIDQLHQQLTEQQNLVSELESKLETILKEKENETNSNFENIISNQQFELSLLNSELDSIKLELRESESLVGELTSKIDELKSENESLMANKGDYLELEKQLCEKNKEIVYLNQLNEALTQNAINLESSLISARDELECKEALLSTSQSQSIFNQKVEIDELNQEITSLKNKVRELKAVNFVLLESKEHQHLRARSKKKHKK
ncbi:hypothetical protein P9112_003443 [Eukaryota sp. TZLM1-RC]